MKQSSAIRRRFTGVALAAALATFAGCGGCDDDVPRDDTFDGNVVIGDASDPAPLDARLRDSGPNDDDGAAGDSGDSGDSGDTGAVTDLDGALLDGGPSACAPEPVRTVTATVAVADRAALVGLVIEVVGTATVAASSCGEPCDAGACACACQAQVAIDGVLPLAPSACFDAPGCQGTACTLVCRPALLGVPQRYRGRVVLTEAGAAAALEILSVFP